MSDGPFSKVKHVIADEYPDIYDDDRVFGCFVKLLMAADAAWPLRPFIPASVSPKALAALVSGGLVIRDRDRYTVLGLDKERDKRRAAARVGGKARAQQSLSASLADRSATAEPSRAEQSRAEAPLPPEEDNRLDIEAFILTRHRIPTPAQRALMDRYQDVFDRTGPERAERLILSNPDDPIGALKADLDEFRRQRTEEARASEVPKPKPRRSPGLPEASKELLAHWAAQRKEAS